MELTDDARALLAGRSGKAMQLAMDLVVKAARIMEAERLLPISFAHLDACFYTGQAHVDFVRFLLDNGAALAVPTWTNNGVVSLADPSLRPLTEDPGIGFGRRRADAPLRKAWREADLDLRALPARGRTGLRRPHRGGRVQCGLLLQFRRGRPHQQVWRLSRRCLRADGPCSRRRPSPRREPQGDAPHRLHRAAGKLAGGRRLRASPRPSRRPACGPPRGGHLRASSGTPERTR